MELVVGVDVATAAVRAVCVEADGRMVAAARADIPSPASPYAGRMEQDASAWWPAVASTLRRLTDGLAARRREIVAVSVSATSGTVVAGDEAGRPLGQALTYADRRAGAEAREANLAGAERWERLGLRVEASFALPKLAWMLRHGAWPRGGTRVLHASDVVVAGLLGAAPPTDWSHALKTGYDCLRLEWPAEVLEALGVPHDVLPEVLPPAALAGTVCAEASRATGLPGGCEIRLGMTDSCAAQIAAGASAPGRAVGVLGTTLVVRGASRTPVADPSGAVYSHRHPQGWWLPGGASNTGGAALGAAFPDADLAEMDARAAAAPASRAVCYPLVGGGERFPFVRADAAGFVVGRPRDDIERYLAILEGVAFVERLCHVRLRTLGLRVDPPVAAAGGGARSRLWSEIRAAALGVPLVLRPGAETALGAAILAAAGTLHPDVESAASAMVPSGTVVEPRSRGDEALEGRYRAFVEALAARGWLDEDLRAGALAAPRR